MGKIAERAGPGREFDASGLATVAEVTDRLAESDDALAALITAPSTITVLDHEVVRSDAPIAGAGELAYLPPVSGG